MQQNTEFTHVETCGRQHFLLLALIGPHGPVETIWVYISVAMVMGGGGYLASDHRYEGSWNHQGGGRLSEAGPLARQETRFVSRSRTCSSRNQEVDVRVLLNFCFMGGGNRSLAAAAAARPALTVLCPLTSTAAALDIADPQLCYILDGFLGLYGLIITGMFIKEKFFKTKVKGFEEPTYAGLAGGSADTYEPLTTDPERGRNRRVADDSTYTGLQRRTEPTYKELPVKREQRQRKNEQVYQGLSSATRDTYDSLQMQPLPAR
ncbi:T-cell surface glycoprotein CD3 zeta chain [Fundulus diaphanus]